MRQTRFVLRLGAVIGACATLISTVPASATAPVPLDYRAYDGWSDARAITLSDNGADLAYVVTPEDADPTLVVHPVAGGADRRAERGSDPVFVDAGRFVLYTHLAPRKEIDAAQNAEKPSSEGPKHGLGVLDTTSGGAAPSVVDAVKSYVYPRERGATIAYLAYPTPEPSASPAAKSEKTTADKQKIEKAKAHVADLTIRNLERDARATVHDVSEVVESEDGRFIAYATESAEGAGDGVHVYECATGTTRDVLLGSGRYRNLAIARDGATLAFLSDTATYALDVPHDALYVASLGRESLAATKVADVGTSGLSGTSAPNANGTVTFSRDGARVFFGTAPVPTPAPSSTPRPFKVDIWSYRDAVLQSQQRHDAEKDRKHTDLAMLDVPAGRVMQLATPALARVEINDNAIYALGLDSRAYRRQTSWVGELYADAYAISLRDGSRRLLARGVTDASLSPGGAYVVAWNEHAKHWVAYATATGKAVTLGTNVPTSFALENDDHPQPPQPYGSVAWMAGDRGVLLDDRYDVWLADPSTGRATALTGGVGRRTHTVYSPVQPDRDAQAFDPSQPVLLSLIGEDTLASGYARVSATGGVPRDLLRVDERVYGAREPVGPDFHDLGFAPVAAAHAPVYAFTRETFRDREVWMSDASFAHLQQMSHLNPQQAKYRWGTERLIHYRGADGTPLRAVMLIPDGLTPNRKAPMLVYFYETMASYYHTYFAPAPGTSPNLTRYVSHGYVVLLPDVRYRVGHPGKSAVNALLPAVDAAVKTGYVDPSHVGIAGHSWAAYQINYLITQTHRFRAVEAGAAVDDMISAYGGIRLESGVVRESQYEHGQSRIGAAPWERPDLYIENSGLFGIRNITTPYLTVHNDGDTAVPQFQGIEFITAMRQLGKTAYMFSFDGEEHGITKRENQKYWTVHLDEWFDYWLQGAPRPSWFDGVPFLQRGERDVDALFAPKT